jgi:hypothetical protein
VIMITDRGVRREATLARSLVEAFVVRGMVNGRHDGFMDRLVRSIDRAPIQSPHGENPNASPGTGARPSGPGLPGFDLVRRFTRGGAGGTTASPPNGADPTKPPCRRRQPGRFPLGATCATLLESFPGKDSIAGLPVQWDVITLAAIAIISSIQVKSRQSSVGGGRRRLTGLSVGRDNPCNNAAA